MTNPATETKSMSGCRPTRWRRVFCSPSRLFHQDLTALVHLSVLAKNAAPRRGRHLIKPPGRYPSAGVHSECRTRNKHYTISVENDNDKT